ncbi:hypothetical protein ACJX0J_028054, partial [Zea mays]
NVYARLLGGLDDMTDLLSLLNDHTFFHVFSFGVGRSIERSSAYVEIRDMDAAVKTFIFVDTIFTIIVTPCACILYLPHIMIDHL